jgi:site-specific DNA-methyltransferase (adenine-specific)
MTYWTVITGSCIDTMAAMPAGSVDLVVADPPYNIGIDYIDGKKADSLPIEMYAAWTAKWIAAAARVLRPGGTMFVICGSDGLRIHEDAIVAAGLELQETIIWFETFGQDRSRAGKYAKCWRPVFWATKPGAPWTFNDLAIRIESARQRAGDKRADDRGKVPENVWAFPRLVGNSKKRWRYIDPKTGKEKRFPTQLPVELVDRIVAGHSNVTETVLDPFTGSGTTGVAAVTAGRVFVGIELREAYAEAARRRIAAVVNAQ